MQTLSEIRAMLSAAGIEPRRRLGQNFLIDGNLMTKLLELADLSQRQTVLEVGAGTGGLTEELLTRAARVVAVEIDRGLFRQLADRLVGRANLSLFCGDVLAGKHALSPELIAQLGQSAVLVSNLPYSIATPLVAQCLADSWRAVNQPGAACTRFDRLTFTVQKEVADRLAAGPGGKSYGPISVLIRLLGRMTPGPVVPASAFWPRPKVTSRIVRIDLDAGACLRVADLDVLRELLAAAFGHRRKQMGSLTRGKASRFRTDLMAAALDAAGVLHSLRPEQVPPEKFEAMAAELARGQGQGPP